MSSQQPGLSEWTPQWTEWGISVLNGMIGDYLHNRRNGLAIGMACYRGFESRWATAGEIQFG